MPKLKKFELHWSATVSGIQIVEAFDEEDAEEQFNSRPELSDMDDEPMHADLDYIHEVKPKRRRK